MTFGLMHFHTANWGLRVRLCSNFARIGRLLFFLAAVVGILLAAQSQAQTGILRNGFQNPPQQAKLRCYWWWLNGNTTEEAIDRELNEMSRKGIGGVLLVDAGGANQHGNGTVPAGPSFGSSAWTRLYLHALSTAQKLHLEVTLNITSGWNLGGPAVSPAEASKLLTWSRVSVVNGMFDGTLPAPPVKNGFYQSIAVLAYPLHHGTALPGKFGSGRAAIRVLPFKAASRETGLSMPPSEPLLEDTTATANEQDTNLNEIVDLTAQVDAAGHLRWQPPSKEKWEILRIGYTDSDARVSTSSDTWQGLAIDYLDTAAFDAFWNRTVAPLLEASRPYLGTTLVHLATDSWEVGGTNWTGKFRDEFRRRRGYDPVPYLPIVTGRIVENRDASNRFLSDLRRTVADLISTHYDRFAERAAAYGLGVQAESGGPHGAPLDALATFRHSAIPQTEFWAPSREHRTLDSERFFLKEAASAANIYGRAFAAAEGPTSIGPQWSESLAADLKPTFDRAVTEGMNRLVWHEFTSSPASAGLPGQEYFAGTHLNPRLTWWNQSQDFFLYLNRVQWMMQQGYAVADVLYLYGNQAPNFVRLKADDPAGALPGFDYDATGEDALLHSLRLEDGAFHSPAGNRYRLLAMPRSRAVSLPALRRIAEFLDQGGVLVGPVPSTSSGLLSSQDSAEFASLLQKIWNGCATPTRSVGKGQVYCSGNARAALASLHIPPDFFSASPALDSIHRRTENDDIYFVRNGSASAISTLATFRVAHTTPQLWNAVDGSIHAPAFVHSSESTTEIPLDLPPYGSIFVVFSPREQTQKPSPVQALPAAKPVLIDLPATQWTIAFESGRGAPVGPQPLAGFTSWSENRDPRIRYFSGTATYRTAVQLNLHPGQSVHLKLSELHEIATVRVNGQPAGTIWAFPLELDLTGKLKNGANTLEIEVANLWPNRIIGDAQPGNHARFTSTNIRAYKADSPLLSSGIIGSVCLEMGDLHD